MSSLPGACQRKHSHLPLASPTFETDVTPVQFYKHHHPRDRFHDRWLALSFRGHLCLMLYTLMHERSSRRSRSTKSKRYLYEVP